LRRIKDVDTGALYKYASFYIAIVTLYSQAN